MPIRSYALEEILYTGPAKSVERSSRILTSFGRLSLDGVSIAVALIAWSPSAGAGLWNLSNLYSSSPMSML